MNRMDGSVTMNPAEGRQENIKQIMVTADNNLMEAINVLHGIRSRLEVKEEQTACELKIADMLTLAGSIAIHSKDCAALAHEIFSVLFGEQ